MTAYETRMNGVKILPAGKHFCGDEMKRFLNATRPFGVVVVKKLSEEPVFILDGQIPTDLAAQLEKMDNKPTILNEENVWQWFLPSTGELIELLFCDRIKQEDMSGIYWGTRHSPNHTISGVRISGMETTKELRLQKHIVKNCEMIACTFGGFEVDSICDCTLDGLNIRSGFRVKRMENVSLKHGRGAFPWGLVNASGCNFDGGIYKGYVGGTFENTSFQNTQLSRVDACFTKCQLQGLTVVGEQLGMDSMAQITMKIMDCDAKGMKLSKLLKIWGNCSFVRSNFAEATFSRLLIGQVVFDECDFSGASFADTLFDTVVFKSCKLDGSDFSGARLRQVTFENSLTDVALFKGAASDKPIDGHPDAYIDCANLLHLPSPVEGLGLPPKAESWVLGFAVYRQGNASRVLLSSRFDPMFGKRIYRILFFGECTREEEETRRSYIAGKEYIFEPDDLETLLVWGRLAGWENEGISHCPDLTFLNEQKALAKPMTPNPMAGLILVHLLLGLDMASMASRIEAWKEERAARESLCTELLGALRGGKAGIKSWNKRKEEASSLEPFDELDLTHAELAGVHLHGFGYKEAKFVGADLTGALLAKADLTLADFSGANLADAKCRGAILHGAVLQEANCSGAVLAGAKLQGADLRNCNLAGVDWTNAQFNRTTLWPEGFEIPEEVKFKGKGTDPRKESTPPPPPDELHPGLGLIALVQHAIDKDLFDGLSAEPGDAAIFRKFLDDNQSLYKREWVDAFAETSMLGQDCEFPDPNIRLHAVKDFSGMVTWADTEYLLRSGFLCFGAMEGCSIQYDLLNGQVLYFEDYLECLVNVRDDPDPKKPKVYDLDTQVSFSLGDDRAVRIIRELLYKNADKTWASLGCYVKYAMGQNEISDREEED